MHTWICFVRHNSLPTKHNLCVSRRLDAEAFGCFCAISAAWHVMSKNDSQSTSLTVKHRNSSNSPILTYLICHLSSVNLTWGESFTNKPQPVSCHVFMYSIKKKKLSKKIHIFLKWCYFWRWPNVCTFNNSFGRCVRLKFFMLITHKWKLGCRFINYLSLYEICYKICG